MGVESEVISSRTPSGDRSAKHRQILNKRAADGMLAGPVAAVHRILSAVMDESDVLEDMKFFT